LIDMGERLMIVDVRHNLDLARDPEVRDAVTISAEQRYGDSGRSRDRSVL
jgi:hypothetical protein